MVEFISENLPEKTEKEQVEEPEAEEEETTEKSLETLVEEQSEEIETPQETEQNYIDEPTPEKGEYFHADEIQLKDAPALKEELKPLIYDENDTPVVIDVLTKYGRKEDKWWLDNINVGVLK